MSITGRDNHPENPGRALPTLPGMVHGIVGMRMDPRRGRNVYTIQCDGCHGLETPTHLVFMKTKFNSRHPGRRLCPDCQPAGWDD